MSDEIRQKTDSGHLRFGISAILLAVLCLAIGLAGYKLSTIKSQDSLTCQQRHNSVFFVQSFLSQPTRLFTADSGTGAGTNRPPMQETDMTTKLTVRDETTTGEVHDAITLEFLTNEITVRELIRERVFQEVKDYNVRQGDTFRGLVQPTDAERTLNGFKMKKPRFVDWKPQFEKACEAFESNSIVVLIDNKQVESLEDTFTITPHSEVSFLKLTPLVGG